MAEAVKRPNIVYFQVDNLGYGELGCYGGGVLRGADTKRIDQFAREGFQLLNFAPEAQCGAAGATYAPQRSCGTNPDCLLQFTGPCRDATVAGNHACEVVVTSPTTYYKACHSEAMGTQGWSAGSTKYPEVITVYLKSADYNALYTSCPALP